MDIVAVQSAEIFAIAKDSMDLKLYVLLRNPHFSAVRVRDITFRFGITEGILGQGHITEAVEIPSDSVKVIVVPLSVRFADVRDNDFLALFKPEIPYHLSGTLRLEKPVANSNVKLETKGTIPAPQRFPVRIQDKTIYNLVNLGRMKIRDFEPLSGRAVLRSRVTNPFRFAIPIQKFQYNFQFNGRVLLEGTKAGPEELFPGVNQLDLPLRVHPLEGLKGLADSLLDFDVPTLYMSGTLVLGRSTGRNLIIDLQVE